MASDFVHLHLHTHYSMLDGACTPKGLVKLANEFDMPAVAMTDHGFMGGTIDFYDTLTAANLNPIIGCEVYLAPGSRTDRNPAVPYNRGFHLVLLAENNDGYHSLCKLLSEAYRTGVYYKPRIDKELLREHHKGLIALSACIGGEIPAMILNHSEEKAEAAIREYIDIFGRENFFLELMDHGMAEEKKSNAALIRMAKKFDLKLVATNDTHYQRREDAKAHEIMLCIQTNSYLSDPRHFSFGEPEFYFKSPNEMKQLFAEVPEAVLNTRLIADRCKVSFKYAPEVNHYPVYTLPDGTVPGKEFLREICLKNMQKRYDFDGTKGVYDEREQKIIDRMDYELGVIEHSGFCSYFLVVSDFIRHAKSQGVPVGPGRGSGAGSVVAYLTEITDIDPLRYNLLFERFLNPERISPPDFDIDFCEQRRSEVIDYVRDKYGHDSVAQICTYGTLKAKAVVKDVARVLEKTFEESNRLTKLIPDEPKMTLEKAKEMSPELKQLIESEDWVREIFDHAGVLEGLNRQLGIHAAGVIIGDQRLDNLVPLARGAQGEVVTQFPSVPCEHLGLLKMDFLGLRTLTIIKNALGMIEENHGIKLNMSKLPLDDQPTYDLLRRGDTVSVFQLESPGMQNLCRSFGVDTIEHIIALLAIYRPGPMSFIPEFIRRKKGEEQIIYDHPKMEAILAETYGIMLYQEQIMQVVQVLAGFTLGGADILRRAIGKKKKDVLDQQKAKFVEGCEKTSGINEALANTIWDKIEMFAGYGFNKSHSAAYAFVSYQTAYLKTHYPVEFMAAVLTSELDNAEKIAFLINACRDMNIKVLPPDVNSSKLAFSVDNGAIRFGLGAIKGVGENAAGKIIASRQESGKFKSFLDFCERVGTAVNSRMIDHLTKAGAFDSLNLRRSQILAIAEPMMAFAAGKARDLAAGQGSLFDLLESSGDTEDNGCNIPIPDIPEFDSDEILKSEKELLGFYVTGHPLAANQNLIEALATMPLREVAAVKPRENEESGNGESQQSGEKQNSRDGMQLRLVGMIGSYSTRFSKNSGKPFGILQLEDMDGSIECSLYEKALKSVNEAQITMEPGSTVVVDATLSQREEGEMIRVIAERVQTLASVAASEIETIYLHFYEEHTNLAVREKVMDLCRRFEGTAKLMICIVDKSDKVIYVEVPPPGVAVTPEFTGALNALIGHQNYKLKAKPYTPPPRPFFRKNGGGEAKEAGGGGK